MSHSEPDEAIQHRSRPPLEFVLGASTRHQHASDWRAVMVGAVGGAAGALAMNLFARAVRTGNHDREAAGAAPGTDRDGRGMQPPQALGNAADDAAVTVGTAVYEAVSGHHPPRDARPWLGSAAHYAFGAATGICYALASSRMPALRAGFGAFYGSLVWAIADEGVMPALRLSRGPRALPLGVHAYALCGHWVYGATVEGVRRAFEDDDSQRALGRRRRPGRPSSNPGPWA